LQQKKRLWVDKEGEHVDLDGLHIVYGSGDRRIYHQHILEEMGTAPPATTTTTAPEEVTLAASPTPSILFYAVL
jgi:uncharacterized protein YfaP (DUF2135 family)